MIAECIYLVRDVKIQKNPDGTEMGCQNIPKIGETTPLVHTIKYKIK